MPIPERIPMALDDYDLRRIGRYGDGNQFIALVTGSLPAHPRPDDWQQHKRWYAVLHRFDADGRHLGTDTWCGGTTADGEALAIPAAERKLEQWLAELGPHQLCDIAVRAFRTEIDGRTFGLIPGYYSDDAVELVPPGLAFYAPWDGSYDT